MLKTYADLALCRTVKTDACRTPQNPRKLKTYAAILHISLRFRGGPSIGPADPPTPLFFVSPGKNTLKSTSRFSGISRKHDFGDPPKTPHFGVFSAKNRPWRAGGGVLGSASTPPGGSPGGPPGVISHPPPIPKTVEWFPRRARGGACLGGEREPAGNQLLGWGPSHSVLGQESVYVF